LSRADVGHHGGSLISRQTAIKSGLPGGVKMNTNEKERLTQAIIELIATHDGVQKGHDELRVLLAEHREGDLRWTR
jgi:hypothetical protein